MTEVVLGKGSAYPRQLVNALFPFPIPLRLGILGGVCMGAVH